MRMLRWTLPVATSIALSSATAFATPTIALQPQPTPVVTRVDTSHVTYGCPARAVQTNSCLVDGTSQGIGYPDCIDDTALSFQLAMTNVPDANYQLQVWAGTGDCTQQGATGNGSTAICWQVAPSPAMALVISPFYVRVADIVRWINVSPPPQGYTQSDALTACNAAKQQSGTTQVTDDAGNSTSTAGETTVTIFFLVFPSGAAGGTPAASASYPVKVKLVGPNAVSNLTAGAGESELVVTWTPPSGDTTVQGFDLFAAPSGSSTGVGDGGQTVCSDASSGTELLDDAGNPVLDDAGNPVFVDDAGNPVAQDASVCTTTGPVVNSCSGTPTFDPSGIRCKVSDAGASTSTNGGYCSQVYGTTNSKGTIQGLQNGTQYDVAVAAFDQFGNSGAISQIVCASPAPIDDFWTLYNRDGGNAFCALGFVGTRGGGIAAALMSIVGALFIARRRRH